MKKIPGGPRTDHPLTLHYDFSWQMDYIPVHPIVVPKGARLEVSAGFDNSPNNPYNPDPTATVRWGDQSLTR